MITLSAILSLLFGKERIHLSKADNPLPFDQCFQSGLLVTDTIYSSSAPRVNKTTQYSIIDMQAKLFYAYKGTFSENIINNPKYHILVNTIIGEGDAGSPACDLLVIVKISGEPNYFNIDTKIKFTASSGNRYILNEKELIPPINSDGVTYISYLVKDCTMHPLHLRAEILGQKICSKTYRLIPFDYGE